MPAGSSSKRPPARSASGRPASSVSPSTPALRRALPVIGLVMAAWAFLPPYTGPKLNTETRVEVADHVVPSLLLVAAALGSLVLARKAPTGKKGQGKQAGSPTTLPLVAGFLITLAGLWMVATHVPLAAQAARGESGVTWGATAYHFTPGLAVLVLGLVWVWAYWSEAPS